ncbi:hypothetical protein ACNQS2_11410, partial [Corynebacterium diphtheriae]
AVLVPARMPVLSGYAATSDLDRRRSISHFDRRYDTIDDGSARFSSAGGTSSSEDAGFVWLRSDV